MDEDNEEIEYYKDENISITYNKKNDDYLILIESTQGFEKHISLDQRIMEGAAKNDLDHLSETLSIMDLSIGLSRTDVIRVYEAILKTMEKYNEKVEEFKAKECL